MCSLQSLDQFVCLRLDMTHSHVICYYWKNIWIQWPWSRSSNGWFFNQCDASLLKVLDRAHSPCATNLSILSLLHSLSYALQFVQLLLVKVMALVLYPAHHNPTTSRDAFWAIAHPARLLLLAPLIALLHPPLFAVHLFLRVANPCTAALHIPQFVPTLFRLCLQWSKYQCASARFPLVILFNWFNELLLMLPMKMENELIRD